MQSNFNFSFEGTPPIETGPSRVLRSRACGIQDLDAIVQHEHMHMAREKWLPRAIANNLGVLIVRYIKESSSDAIVIPAEWYDNLPDTDTPQIFSKSEVDSSKPLKTESEH